MGATIFETEDRARRLDRLWPALAVFAIGALVTVVAYFAVDAREREREALAFGRRAAEIAGTLETGLDLPVEVLISVPALFEASVDVSRQEFRRFTSGALERHEGIYALEWLPLVRAADRARYVAAAWADGVTGFRFKEEAGGEMVPAGERPFYLPIYYMEPPNEIALGFDVASEADRFAPAERAALSGNTVASPRIRLVEDPPSVYSIAVFHPVYRLGAALGSPEARWDSLRGVAAEVFRVAPMVERALRTVDTEALDLVLLDADAPQEMRLLYENRPGARREAAEAELNEVIEFSFADRTWSLTVAAGPGYGGVGTAAWSLLAGGLLLSALVGVGIAALRLIASLRRQVREAMRLGQYTLVDKIGEGGMGVVYKARHALLRRPTAIKLLPSGRHGEQRLQRFEREVQMTSRLTHPNTIAIYDYGRTEEGLLYYVMEYIDGIAFDRLVATYGPVPASRVAHLLRQVCGALAEAHEVGLVHRDIKPANLMLCIHGGIADFVKVLDFGLVKELGPTDSDLSRPDAFVGTPLYLAPESVRSPKNASARSDLYAVGCVAYYLLTGTPVFEGENVLEVCSHHLYTEPDRPSKRSELPVPEMLDELVLRCLRKDPEERPSGAREIIQVLESSESLRAWTEEDADDWWKLHEPGRYAAARGGRSVAG